MLALHPHCTTCGQSVGDIPQGTPVLADPSLLHKQTKQTDIYIYISVFGDNLLYTQLENMQKI
jgi:hypothetical protein